MTARKQRRDAVDDYEVVEVNAGIRVGGIVSVRLKPEEMDLLTALSEARRLTLSETLRLGLRCLSDQPETAADALGDRAGSTSSGVADVVFSANREAWTRSNS
jgi:ABC-type amino acid transport system permease subunit